MLGNIDLTKKPIKPQIFLARPNRQIVGKLNHVSNDALTVNLGTPDELSFDVPYMLDIHHEFKRNPNIDNIRVQYLIKLVYGNLVEWFIIDKITEGMDTSGDKKTVHAYSLAYQLSYKRMRNYQEDSQTATQQLTATLAETTWSIGYVDPMFDALYRGIDISSNTVLEVINQIATTFNALISYDTVNKTVSLLNPDTNGTYKGLHFKYGKYLNTLGNDIDSSNMVTELKAFGQNDLTIGGVNPTGGDSIINLDFFMQGFEMDDNGNIVSSSPYMSDSLCTAITNYNKLADSKTDSYTSLLTTLTTQQETLTTKQTDLQTLKDTLTTIQDNLDLQRSQKTLNIYNLIYDGSSVTKTFTLNPYNYYAVMIKVTTATNLSVKMDSYTISVPSNQWAVIGKLSGQASTTMTFSGSATRNTITMYIVQITSDEHTHDSNSTDLLNKYNDQYEQELIDAKQSEVNSAQSDVNDTQSQINAIVDSLSLENNFTSDQLEERDSFIITQEWSDSNYIDAQSLYDAAVKQLQTLQSPPTQITMDVVNFLEVVEAQRDWDKLVLGDKVRISYDLFNLDVNAQITQIQYNFENYTIQLTISNVTEIQNDENKFIQKLYSGITASKSIDMSKYKWDTAVDANTKIDNYTSSPIDTSKQPIIAGVSGSVTIDNRGVTYTDPTNANNKVIAQAGTVALSTDGGETWKTAMTAQGTQAEQLIGTIILAEVLNMQNSSGTMTFDENGLTLATTDNTKRTLINEADGIKIQQSTDNGTTWTDQFYVDSNGQLIAKGIALYTPDGTSKILDGTDQTIDFSNLTSQGQLTFLDDNGNSTTDVGSGAVGFNSINVGQITSPSIYNATFDDINISLTNNIRQSLHSIPPLNNGTATLTFQNDISENIDISNYLGDGSIIVDLNGHTLNGNIYIHGCAPQYINIKNGTINGSGQGLTLTDAVVEIDRCTYVRLDDVKIYGNGNPTYGVFTHAGSGAYISQCEIYNVQEAISSSTSAQLTCDNCKGLGGTYGLNAFDGGNIVAFGSQPGGSSSNVSASSGQVYPNGGTTVNTGSATPPPAPAQTTTWNAVSGNNWSNLYNSWSNDGVKQGNYGYGRRSGYWFFGSNPSTTVTGKTIQSMRVKVSRSSQGGSSGSMGVILHSHNYATQPTTPSPLTESSYSTTVDLSWSQSSWVSLPSTFFSDFESGVAKGIGIYVDSDSSSDYAVMSSSATLEITYS